MLVGVHDRAEASALADRLLIMIDGSLVVDGPPRELFESPPSAAVARFLGYDGELSYNDGLLLTRRSHVRLDPAGRLTARVVRTIPGEDGARVELECETGRVFAFVGYPANPRRR
jgi:ABC-type sulfate/molybdate transport systems ATPase subunit